MFWLGVLAALCLLVACSSCSTSPAGLRREAGWYSGATNAVSLVGAYVVPVVPSPWHEVATAALAFVSAGLGAWNMSQAKRLRALENGVPARGNVKN